MPRIRTAIVGTGGIARSHAQATLTISLAAHASSLPHFNKRVAVAA